MKRQFWIGIPILVAILATGAGIARSKQQETPANAPDMTGSWIVDLSKSDAPPDWRGPGRMGRPGRGGHGGGGGWRGRPDAAGPENGGERRGRFARLPERFRIRQTAGTLSVVDSVGAPLEEIIIGRAVDLPPAGMEDEKVVPTFGGTWKKDRLEVVRKGRRGAVTQSFQLTEEGKLLVIRTSMEARDSRPAMEFKRVYRRAAT